jgi:hypothetical protein
MVIIGRQLAERQPVANRALRGVYELGDGCVA